MQRGGREEWLQNIGAVCRALAPDPEFGAKALGADRYVEAQIGSLGGPGRDRIRAGIAALAGAVKARTGLPLTELTAAALERELASWEAEPWLGELVALTEEGLYADPGNGGNRYARSWKRLGYRHGLPEGPDGPPLGEPMPPHPRPLEDAFFDAIVVGSGAGGGIVAARMARAGKRILLIERGRWRSYADSGRRDHLRNHRLSLYGVNTGPEADGNPRVHVGPDGHARRVAPHEFDYHNNASCVGGGTLVHGGLAWRFHPDDFRMASKYGVPEASSLVDWPIGYDDLEAWYGMAEAEIGVAGDAGGDPHAARRRSPYPMAPVPRYASARVLKKGADRLGISTFTPPLLVNTVAHDGRSACIACGSCVGFPCPTDAKNGTQNTVIPKALASGNLTLLTETVATRIETDAAGRVTGVTVAWEADGGAVETQQVFSHLVVVAAGAIETARLLLLSPSARQEHGLGNESGLVGRNLQGHFYATAYGLFDTEVFAERGPGVTIATTDFVHDNPGVIGGAVIADDFVMPPVIFRKVAWPPDRRRWGREAEAFMAHAYRRVTQLRAPVHEIPDATCRVTLDRAVRDKWGLPVARLSGVVHTETMRTAHVIYEKARQWLGAAGARDIWGKVPARRLSAYQHQAGTCRMGTDPRTSVTDGYGRVWGHDNLFVTDASLHPTNGAYNPVLTIMALAFRNAEHILETWP